MPRTKNKAKKLHVKKGDIVQVVAGNDKGESGKVLVVYPSKERVLVEGINMRTKHQKPNQQFPQGGRVEQEAPIHVSNVMPLHPSTGEPTRVGRKLIEDATGKRWVRTTPDGEVLD